MSIREKIARFIYPQIFDEAASAPKIDNDKSSIDLTRECLKLTPLKLEYEVDGEKYDREDYLVLAIELLENPMFDEEIKRIMFEQVNYIATQSPTELSSTLARGSINGVSLLKERIMVYKELFDQKQEDKKKNEEEAETTGLTK